MRILGYIWLVTDRSAIVGSPSVQGLSQRLRAESDHYVKYSEAKNSLLKKHASTHKPPTQIAQASYHAKVCELISYINKEKSNIITQISVLDYNDLKLSSRIALVPKSQRVSGRRGNCEEEDGSPSPSPY